MIVSYKYGLHHITFLILKLIVYNGWGISKVPREARNLDEAIAKSDMHLLGVGESSEVSERRVRRCSVISNFSLLLTLIPSHSLRSGY